MSKVRLLGLKKDEAKILGVLQEAGVLELHPSELPETWRQAGQDAQTSPVNQTEQAQQAITYQLARLEFAIKFLKPQAPKRGLLAGRPQFSEAQVASLAQEFAWEPLVVACEEAEQELNNLRLQLAKSKQLVESLRPWQELPLDLSAPRAERLTSTLFMMLPSGEAAAFKAQFAQQVPLGHLLDLGLHAGLNAFAAVLAKQQLPALRQLLVQHKGHQVDLPALPGTPTAIIKEQEAEQVRLQAEMTKIHHRLASLAKQQEKLQTVYDYYTWQAARGQAGQLSAHSVNTFALEGWMPTRAMLAVEKQLAQLSPVVLTAITPKKDEEPPVMLRNVPVLIDTFESVTKVYGLPQAGEADPTPFLAAFFITFFALCLTDAAYGIILFLLTAAALLIFKLPAETKKLVRLIMFGGLLTVVAGTLFGGWFGMTADQAPAFLTETVQRADGVLSKQFKFQIINPTEGNGPLTFLIFAFALGVLHIMFGIAVDGYWKLRTRRYLDALLDSFLWLAFLTSILGYALSQIGVLPGAYAGHFKTAVLTGVVLMILTQGRKQKGIIAKLGMGVLSLYCLVGYASDILSYSRLMALGLGTGIVAFAVNTIAGLVGEMVPYVGVALAVVVLIIGHTVNIALNALGAFIHSGRLQFVEFFGKFLSGGGREFRPLRRDCKYIAVEAKA